MARIFALSNQKGGVGKTTTAINLSAALALAGQRVLLVDLDPQGNATSGLGIAREALAVGAYEVLMGHAPLQEAVVGTTLETLDVLPANQDLVGAEVELVAVGGREKRLRTVLGPAHRAYDWVIIDCPPSLGLLTLNALTAADRLLIPLQAEYYAMEGLSHLMRTVQAVRKSFNPDLRREGIVVTMYDGRNNLCQEVAEQARELFGDEVFQATIPRNVRLGEAPSHGASIFAYAPKSPGARAYLALAAELMERHGMEARFPKEALA